MINKRNEKNNGLTLVADVERGKETPKQKLSAAEKRDQRVGVIKEDFRSGRLVTDFRFDQIYPGVIRNLSETHWTPIEVAIRAAKLLVRSTKTRVLDVGSGCGKFCTIGALATPGIFVGIEQRPHLIEVARGTAKELGASRASFIHGNMIDLDWSFFDSFYLFNPFYENKYKSIRIDDTVSFGLDKYNRYVEMVRRKLHAARVGTRVVTYHGFGGDVPMGFKKFSDEAIGSSYLELWVKTELLEPAMKKIE